MISYIDQDVIDDKKCYALTNNCSRTLIGSRNKTLTLEGKSGNYFNFSV